MSINTFSYSVVLPTTNGRCLCKAFYSALMQSLPPSEIHITTDSEFLPNCCTKSIAGKSIVTLHRKLNFFNVSESRNYAINKSQSKWISFLDDDDYWEFDKMQIQSRILLSSKVKLLGSNAYKISSNDLYFKTELDRKFNLKELTRDNLLITSSVVVRKDTFYKVGGFPRIEGPGEDYLLWLKVILSTRKGIICGKPLVYYNDAGQSISRAKFESGVEQRNRILKEFLKLPKKSSLGMLQEARYRIFLSNIKRNLRNYE